jgi:hypothetical protein
MTKPLAHRKQPKKSPSPIAMWPYFRTENPQMIKRRLQSESAQVLEEIWRIYYKKLKSKYTELDFSLLIHRLAVINYALGFNNPRNHKY